MKRAPGRIGLLCIAALLLGTGCNSNSFGYRNQSCDPEQRLAELLAARTCAEHGGECSPNDGHIVVDCERIDNELERLALEFPRNVPVLYANAQVAYEKRERVKALRYLNALFAVEPVNPEAAVLRSRVSIDEGNVPAAVRWLEAQVRSTPDNAELREAHAAALYMKGDWAGARQALDVAALLGAPAWRIDFHRGLVAEAVGDARSAERHYQDALRADPELDAATMRLRGLRAVHDASAGDIDRLHRNDPGERSPSGLAILSGK
jgi:tetratricopeptide (TPR) repeat protein